MKRHCERIVFAASMENAFEEIFDIVCVKEKTRRSLGSNTRRQRIFSNELSEGVSIASSQSSWHSKNANCRDRCGSGNNAAASSATFSATTLWL